MGGWSRSTLGGMAIRMGWSGYDEPGRNVTAHDLVGLMMTRSRFVTSAPTGPCGEGNADDGYIADDGEHWCDILMEAVPTLCNTTIIQRQVARDQS